MPGLGVAVVLACLAALAEAFPTSMYSCDNLPAPGGSLPGDGNAFMQITAIQPGQGGYCQFSGLPTTALPCVEYEFRLSSPLGDKLAQLVAVTNHGTIRASSSSGTAVVKSDQCLAVNTPTKNFTYYWTAPATMAATTTQFTALCGKMGAVYAAPPVQVTIPANANNEACLQQPPSVPTLAPSPPQCIVPLSDIQDDVSYDYYTLALQWPPGVRTKAKDMDSAYCRDDITLRGLWPSRSTDVYTFPHDCTEQAFVVHDLNPSLRKQMALHWPSLKNPGFNAAFWNHEWQVHGTCAADYASSYDYFLAALRLRSLFVDQLQTGFLQKFPPSTKTRYRVQEIIQYLGEGAVLACNGDVLTEFHFCLDKDTKQRRPCPETVCNCNGTSKVFLLPKDCANGDASAVIVAVVLILVFTAFIPIVYCLAYKWRVCDSCCHCCTGGGRGSNKVEDGYSSPEEEGLAEEEEMAPRPVIRRNQERQVREDDFEI
ncbi:hypothetical protein BASA81_009094 [Batrachochytrium salamandrivorans]|nr:hypothetical protein BASA81_009094 [Batrachochytrium salamandrivorans]